MEKGQIVSREGNREIPFLRREFLRNSLLKKHTRQELTQCAL